MVITGTGTLTGASMRMSRLPKLLAARCKQRDSDDSWLIRQSRLKDRGVHHAIERHIRRKAVEDVGLRLEGEDPFRRCARAAG